MAHASGIVIYRVSLNGVYFVSVFKVQESLVARFFIIVTDVKIYIHNYVHVNDIERWLSKPLDCTLGNLCRSQQLEQELIITLKKLLLHIIKSVSNKIKYPLFPL